MMSARFLAPFLACSLSVGAAEATMLNGQQIKDMINGRAVYLSTPFGIELPLRYAEDGTVRGDISGFAAGRLFAPRETGKWWIADDRLCQQWPTWYKGRRFCFTIEQTGETAIRWRRDDGAVGTARLN